MEGLFQNRWEIHPKMPINQMVKKRSEFRDGSIFGCTESLNIPRFSSNLGIKYYCLQVDFKVRAE